MPSACVWGWWWGVAAVRAQGGRRQQASGSSRGGQPQPQNPSFFPRLPGLDIAPPQTPQDHPNHDRAPDKLTPAATGMHGQPARGSVEGRERAAPGRKSQALEAALNPSGPAASAIRLAGFVRCRRRRRPNGRRPKSAHRPQQDHAHAVRITGTRSVDALGRGRLAKGN